MSLSDFPLLYAMMGGSLYTSDSVLNAICSLRLSLGLSPLGGIV